MINCIKQRSEKGETWIAKVLQRHHLDHRSKSVFSVLRNSFSFALLLRKSFRNCLQKSNKIGLKLTKIITINGRKKYTA